MNLQTLDTNFQAYLSIAEMLDEEAHSSFCWILAHLNYHSRCCHSYSSVMQCLEQRVRQSLYFFQYYFHLQYFLQNS
uniref:Umc1463 n=1 Tax=Arundo donax TaxID=35708 RepID=A0A0A9C1Z9_ARUDO